MCETYLTLDSQKCSGGGDDIALIFSWRKAKVFQMFWPGCSIDIITAVCKFVCCISQRAQSMFLKKWPFLVRFVSLL